MKVRTALLVAAWVTEALVRSLKDELNWWCDARRARREYIGGLSNAEIDHRLRARE